MSEDTYNEDFLKCPHCGYEDNDSFELGGNSGVEGEGITECGNCEKDIAWQRIISIDYKGKAIAPSTPASAAKEGV